MFWWQQRLLPPKHLFFSHENQASHTASLLEKDDRELIQCAMLATVFAMLLRQILRPDIVMLQILPPRCKSNTLVSVNHSARARAQSHQRVDLRQLIQ